ncbi:NAD(P)H-binding protein [Amycolatopsis kentuckyensis]|uniref:NAD(P)H-binding protein n=1 Tax=Amycolatopsis kentuckyensis TaxID=218823 RepID=UPI000A3824A0|nr:NAD(P)H-binding protein [Amycolatopsis kentuckyensis]
MAVLVTGARGAVAREVVSQLLAAGERVRAASAAGPPVGFPSEVDTVHADLGDPATLPAALAGVEKVFLYAEPAGADGFAAAALAAGVRHVVLLSSGAIIHPGAGNGPIALKHAAVEKVLEASGIPWTFVRPDAFAANALQWAAGIRAEGVVRTAFPAAASAPIHERDVAEVVVTTLLEPGHEGTAPALSGPESLTQAEQIGILSDVLGRPVRVQRIAVAEARRQLEAVLPVAFAEFLVEAQAAAELGPATVRTGVADITGRLPLSFVEWAKEHAGDFRAPVPDLSKN